MNKKIKQLIEKHDIVSFDIFDTLLTRPYVNPYDLLKHIEIYTNADGFAENRLLAESNARFISSKEDITIENIYSFVSNKFKYLQNTELQFEERLLTYNPKVKEIYDWAKKLNKKIYLISDMYLPKDFLEMVLRKNGYDYWENFYLSGEVGVAKYTGGLFKVFLNDIKAKPSSVIHIGDSKLSDIKQAQKCGIHTYHIRTNIEQFFAAKQNKRCLDLYLENKNSVGISIIISNLADKYVTQKSAWTSQKYWYSFGYYISSVIAYGFAQFILKETHKQNYKELLFTARDGYILKKIVDIFKNENINTYYIYAQRILRARILLDYGDEHNADLLLHVLDEKINREVILNNFNDKQEYISKNVPLLQACAHKKQIAYKQYLLNLGINPQNNIAIVDTGAATFSAQQLVEKTLDQKATGLYTIITKPEYAKQKNICYKVWTKNNNEVANLTSLIEFCLTSPEPPIVDLINEKPVYEKFPQKAEINRGKICSQTEKGCLDFVIDLQKRLNGLDIEIPANEINEYIKAFCMNLSKKDRAMLASVQSSSNAFHTEYKHNLLKQVLDVCKSQERGKNLAKFKWNRLFSITNEYEILTKHKVINIFGIKIKFRCKN